MIIKYAVKSILILMAIFISLSSVVLGKNNKKILEKLSKESEIIVVGKVSSKESFWNESKTRIISKVTINPYEYFKGNSSSSEITVKVLGGEVDGVGELYTHVPTLDSEEEVIIFARKDNKDDYTIIGGEMGKVKMIRDRTTGKLMTPSQQNISELKREIKKYIAD